MERHVCVCAEREHTEGGDETTYESEESVAQQEGTIGPKSNQTLKDERVNFQTGGIEPDTLSNRTLKGTITSYSYVLILSCKGNMYSDITWCLILGHFWAA